MKATKIILSLGSNMGNRRENLVKALSMLEEFCAFSAKSRIYSTPPVGYEDQRDFLNAAVFGETLVEPMELLRQCKRLERELGREENFANGPRPIDIDIIFYGRESISNAELTAGESLSKYFIVHLRNGIRSAKTADIKYTKDEDIVISRKQRMFGNPGKIRKSVPY